MEKPVLQHVVMAKIAVTEHMRVNISQVKFAKMESVAKGRNLVTMLQYQR